MNLQQPQTLSHRGTRRGPTAASVDRPRIRVLLTISSLERGGAERQVVHLANHLDAQRFEVHVCCLSEAAPLADDLRGRDHRLHLLSKRWKYDAGVVVRVARLMRRLGIHVAHAFLFDAEMVVRLAAAAAGVPVVVASERNSDYRLGWKHWVCQRLTRGGFDALIANSEAGRRFAMRTLGLEFDRVHVIRNGVDVERFRPGSGTEPRRSLGLRPDAPVVGMVATLKRQKNHGDFLRAASRVLTTFPRAQFVCVGEAMRDNLQGAEDYAREVRQLLYELRLHHRCRFIGGRSDMPSVYRAFDVTVLPSLHEGTPNVLLESMACGVPAVATDVADNATVVPDGRAGFIVPTHRPDVVADRVGRLLSGDDARRRMGAWARDWTVTHFSLSRLAAQTGELYARLLEAKSRGAVRGEVGAVCEWAAS
jgi:glycosyltransferase involved in cell wall biosynthesis